MCMGEILDFWLFLFKCNFIPVDRSVLFQKSWYHLGSLVNLYHEFYMKNVFIIFIFKCLVRFLLGVFILVKLLSEHN